MAGGVQRRGHVPGPVYRLVQGGAELLEAHHKIHLLVAEQDAGRPDSVWFHYTRNDAYAQKGAAYVFDRFVGIDKDAQRPADFDKENGWVVKSFFDKDDEPYITADKWYLYKEGTDIDMHQYWPIFDVNVAASNGTLWNDYLY